jgi:mono/diheme cytochrome c family protein
MHARLVSAAVALVSLSFALGCATSKPAPEPTSPSADDLRLAAGRVDYEAYCMACHGIEADGKGPIAPYMTPRPSDLRRIAARRGGVFPHAKLVAWIDGRDPIASHGTRDMPIWGATFREETELDQLSETRVKGRIVLLVQYLESIQLP